MMMTSFSQQLKVPVAMRREPQGTAQQLHCVRRRDAQRRRLAAWQPHIQHAVQTVGHHTEGGEARWEQRLRAVPDQRPTI